MATPFPQRRRTNRRKLSSGAVRSIFLICAGGFAVLLGQTVFNTCSCISDCSSDGSRGSDTLQETTSQLHLRNNVTTTTTAGSAAAVPATGSETGSGSGGSILDDAVDEKAATDDIVATKSIDKTTSAGVASLRLTLKFLLDSLPPDITTQRELSFATTYSTEGIITLATQGGIAKLPRLLDLIERWQGPISCALPITTMNDLDQFLLFYDTNSNILNRFVSFHIFVERPPYQENPKRPVNRHPINRLRNLAMRNIQTDFVFLNDIDFIPTANAHDQLAPLVQRDLSPKTLWVLPAFERFSDNKKKPITDVNLIPKTKLDLRKAIDAKHVAPFHEYFKPGHGPTQYKKWISSEQMYTIEYHYLFEPYVIAHRQGLPQYFPEFRGFANNKMTWFVEAHLLGYKFEVLPQHFVVHMNHSGRKGRSDRGGDSHIIKEHFKHYLKKVYKVSDLELVLW